MLFLPDRHLGLEGVDQLRAGCQRRLPVNRADGHHDGEVADLEVADPVLDRERYDVVRSAASAAQRASTSAALGCWV